MDNKSTLGEIGSFTPVTVAPDTTMAQATKLMDEKRISCLVVTEKDRPVGILTERDLVRNISRDRISANTNVSNFMGQPPIVAPQNMLYLEGYHLCAEHGIRHLILVDNKGILTGVVTETDFMDHLGLDAYVELKPVSGVMTRRPLTVNEDQPISDAWDLMSAHDISCVVVEREGRPVGILSERDMVHLSQSRDNDSGGLIGEMMSGPVITITAGESLHEAASVMREQHIRRLVVVDDDGMLAGIVTAHDVVKGLDTRYTTFLRQMLKRQSNELERTRKRLNESLVLENILHASFNMGILAADLEQRVRYFNPAAERVFGVEAVSAVGQSLKSLYLDADFDQQELEAGTSNADQGKAHEFELECPGDSGDRILHFRIAPITDKEGTIQGYVHTVSDITADRKTQSERERLQFELMQARKMEAIGQLTGGIAHDFNNILASVLGYNRLALDCHDTNDVDRIPDYLTEVHSAGKRAQDLVRQLLAFSRSSPQRPKKIQLEGLIRDVAKMLRSTLPSTLSLRLSLDKNAPAVRLDPVQVQQLLMNLILNARDAIDGHGSIFVELRLIHENESSNDSDPTPESHSWVEVSVRDTGEGIPAEVRERIFEPFFTTKEVGRGSGMGLAVVHGIVTQNGGRILVESEPDQGTCFRVQFRPSETPLDSVEQPEPAPIGKLEASHTGVRILVADDDTSVAGFLGELLERAGHLPTVVTNGQEALDVFRNSSNAFDLVIADQVMPKMTGLELASKLHELQPALPVILATGFSEEFSEGHLDKTGPMNILTKPIEPEDLLKTITGYVRLQNEQA